MKTKVLSLLLLLMLAAYSTYSQSKSIFKKPHYEEVDFEDLMHRYLGKEAGVSSQLEGIYSVSCTIVKTSKAFLSG